MPITTVYATKGGQGVTTITAALAIVAARAGQRTLLIDTAGDLPAVLATPTDIEQRPGLAEYLTPASRLAIEHVTTPVSDNLDLIHRGTGPVTFDTSTYGLLTSALGHYDHVIIDATEPTCAWTSHADHRLLVTRPCYLALRRATLGPRPTAIVLINEPGRALDARDIEAVLGMPVTATVPYAATIARAVDAGLLTTRLPRELTRALRPLLTSAAHG